MGEHAATRDVLAQKDVRNRARDAGQARRDSALTIIMPPKRADSKRKVSSDSEVEQNASKKKQKFESGSSSQPTNKVIPVNITFPPRAENAIRIAAFNVCGLAASQKKAWTYIFRDVAKLNLNPGFQALC